MSAFKRILYILFCCQHYARFYPFSLQGRVDKMERLMGTVANKVNDVLLKLDEFESSGRKLSAKVRKISSASSKSTTKMRHNWDFLCSLFFQAKPRKNSKCKNWSTKDSKKWTRATRLQLNKLKAKILFSKCF